MSKKTESIIARLDELEKAQKEDRATLAKELEDTRRKIALLNAQRETAATPEDYKHITADLNESNTYLEYLENRKNSEPAHALTFDEYKEIKNDLDAELDGIIKKCAPNIYENLMPLITTFETYAQATDELTAILKKAKKLMGGFTSFSCVERNKIMNEYDDRFEWYKTFIASMFEHHDRIKTAMTTKDVERNPWTPANVRKWITGKG